MAKQNLNVSLFFLILFLGILLAGCNNSGSSDDDDGDDTPTLTYKLPDTGQIAHYYGPPDFPLKLPCGEDSDYSINPPSFTDNHDKTVTDKNTGLIWQQEGKNGCNSGGKCTLSEAETHCNDLELAGRSDWRLPHQSELMSIVDYGKSNPAIAPTFTSTVSSHYWSSTVYTPNTVKTRYVDFSTGRTGTSGNRDYYYVRCVRGSQPRVADFSDNGNNTVTDKRTGLIWQQKDDSIKRTWEEALIYCENLRFPADSTQKKDWRLPNIKELASIVDDSSVFNPIIDKTAFPYTGSSYSYWSSTANASVTYTAWCVSFYDGNVSYSNRGSHYYVRCVRSEQ